MTLTQPEEILFKLLQAALWETPLDCPCIQQISNETWSKVQYLALHHGVLPLAYEGMLCLPLSCQPPREIKLMWMVHARNVEERNLHTLETVEHLNSLFKSHNINMMVLKGVGLASCYPIPTHRESGDIDIWLFGKFEEGNRLIAAQGIQVDNSLPKHSGFKFEGVWVENHQDLLNSYRSTVDKKIEDGIIELLTTEPTEMLALCDTKQVQVPSPTFQAAFILRHMTVHFPKDELVIRHLCDWACFLSRYKNQIDEDFLFNLFNGTVMKHLMPVYTKLAVEYLGMPTQYAPSKMQEPDSNLTERIWAGILSSPERAMKGSKSTIQSFSGKLNRFFRNRWAYNLVYETTTWKDITHTIARGFQNPHILYR